MAPEKKSAVEAQDEKTAESPETTEDILSALSMAADDDKMALEAARAEARDFHDRMLRMAAELDNYKKRVAREQDDLRKFSTEKLLGQLLTVVDNLERAISSAEADSQCNKGLIEGVTLTLAETLKILAQNHVTPVESLGKPFDPVFHQAMSQEARDDMPPNTVVQEYQKGYLIHDRLLRPAMVVVSKAVQNGQTGPETVDTHV
ncbi:nucleotide exchange factor GrpE [Desulfosarcina sp. OttesenSCG-928-A07]|nr:nucleotide exchange factor GrpE [Desulfosarcina sp. OttesenSCG-928-G17]MDL2330281.1 nucleotide exchange factor GrpE [Desulfosarcina sp. OttesenSCG-928-A07]